MTTPYLRTLITTHTAAIPSAPPIKAMWHAGIAYGARLCLWERDRQGESATELVAAFNGVMRRFTEERK